ncbi:MAG: sulfatase-like hydrolase/transferase [Candidatus Sumerlaeota bacterium]|nr:sulfatase-like hydrolase/transferase [Candidatus Sumerlaeota bacterium]
MKRPNILFIFTDDQRFDTLSAMGNPEIDTPNLDRLAARGTLFTHAHIMGGTSGAVCMPSRAMLMTGRTLFRIEGQGQRIPPEHTTMPEQFRKAGYVTAHVGKWHQDRASHARSFSTGAKIFGFRKKKGWYEACNGHWHIPVHDFDPTGSYEPGEGYNDPPIAPFEAPFETVKENGRHSAEVFSDAAIEIIRNHPASPEGRAGKPFFLYLAHIAPHDPRQCPARIYRQYPAARVSLPPNFAIRHPFDNGDLRVRDELLAAFPRRPHEVRRHLADYYAIIAHVDEQVGRVLDALEESGQADNTIMVFASDNGLAVGQHGLMGKQNVYDHSVRVPLILAGPGIPQGQRTDAPCYLLDIFPTLCDLAGVAIPETVEGRSLVPAIRTPGAIVRDSLHFAYKQFQRAVRKDNFKLIEYSVKGVRTTQLFNLGSDPYERVNLAAAPEHQDRLRDLRAELDRWRTELGDTQEMGREFWGE